MVEYSGRSLFVRFSTNLVVVQMLVGVEQCVIPSALYEFVGLLLFPSSTSYQDL